MDSVKAKTTDREGFKEEKPAAKAEAEENCSDGVIEVSRDKTHFISLDN